MTTFDRKIMQSLATKMGVQSEVVLRKAEELMRRLQLRMTGATAVQKLSDPCRVVLCLNLACDMLNTPFSKTDVPRLAGVNRKQYSSALHLVEKILDVSPPVTINHLCVQFNVSEVAPLAQKILDKYVELHSQSINCKRPLDTSLPVYHCAAIFSACKHRKLRVDKSAILEASRMKRAQFYELVAEFSSAVDQVKLSESQKVANKRQHKLIELVEKYMEDSAKENGRPGNESNSPDEKEDDFETWKKRILSQVE